MSKLGDITDYSINDGGTISWPFGEKRNFYYMYINYVCFICKHNSYHIPKWMPCGLKIPKQQRNRLHSLFKLGENQEKLRLDEAMLENEYLIYT